MTVTFGRVVINVDRLEKRVKKVGGFAVAVVLCVGLGVASSPAYADDLDVFDPSAVLGHIAPGDLAGSTAPEGAVVTGTVDSGNASRGSTSSDALEVQLNLGDVSTLDLGEGSSAARLSPDVAITVPFATHEVAHVGTMEVWGTESASDALYVQPLTNGVRFFTVVGASDSVTSFDYALDIPADATVVQDSTRLQFFGEGGAGLGSFHTPWVRDSEGREIPTTYEWSDGVITQTIDSSAQDVAYPLVAQAGWSYSMQWEIYNKTVAQNRTNLYTCFNCLFPVGGAPRNFPSFGQDLPLFVAILPGVNASFHCTMDMVLWESSSNPRNQYFGWTFWSASGHVDGPGSTITFLLSPSWDSGATTTRSALTVDAWITNDNPMGIGQPAYQAGAYLNWQNFAFNLRAA